MISQQVTSPPVDIAIVGSGLAGSALACALGGLGLRVALIEAQPLSLQWPGANDDVDGFDPRVSALTESSRAWLEQLGAWPLVAVRRISPYRAMEVWDGEGTGAIHFHAEEVNQPTLGHIVENGLLQTALLHALQSKRDVQVLSPARVASFERKDDGVLIHLEDQRELFCHLLIGADGAQSRVREWAGLRVREWDYGHTAIVATVATEQAHGACARQIFRREGPLALLPLRTANGGEQLCSIVWSTSPEEAEMLLTLDDIAFASALGDAFQHRLGAITATSQRFSFPLRARHAVDYVAVNVALIGDAAHTIHPLAGQGINLGFLDAQALAEEIQRAVTRGLGPADTQALARYQRRRKGDNWAVLGAMEGFKRLFGSTALLPRWLRNSGMNALDRIEPVKRLLIRQAMRIGPG
ncbi:MAG: UbiH/UbiF/VisC/COQ6 family ubiquinone biosynthesis hydroxylase [Spongiibacteraceae bacterium]